jgi:hypothetical protein
MAASRSALSPITASLTVLGIGAALSLAVGIVVGLVTGEMAKSVGFVGTWGMVVTAVAAGGAVAVASMHAESSEAESS